ncbi:hypothetical protein [Actinocorallia longicatena]|uniref:Sigma-70 family RNA polymerase sigma factor n=1 Tax=Actinocorallia longicatena TaxID=111803 RepID=A0ABP6QMF2_9ACTN
MTRPTTRTQPVASTGFERRGRTNVLDTLADSFTLLTTGPAPLALNGKEIGRGLPARLLPLDEVRGLLLASAGDAKAHYELRDAVWAELVRRSRTEGPAWVVGCCGVALPGLLAITNRIGKSLPHAQAEDVASELLTAFLAALQTVDLDRRGIASRLMWAARRAATRARYRDLRETPLDPHDITPEQTVSALPAQAPASDHDETATDLIGRAVEQRVITREQADLIIVTRIGGTKVSDLARSLEIPAHRLYERRERAEKRLVAAVLDGQVSAK